MTSLSSKHKGTKKTQKKEKTERKEEKTHTTEMSSSPETTAAAAPSSSSPPPAAAAAPAAPAEAVEPSNPLCLDGEIRLFKTSSPHQHRMVLHMVTTPSEAAAAMRRLSRECVVGVDCEGVSLSRTGQLCLVQVSTEMEKDTGLFHVYLFDVVALGEKAFSCGLSALLTAPHPRKLFYDVRRDSEALYHQFGVKLQGVLDIQLLEIARRRLRQESNQYLPGLARLIGERFPDLDATLQTIKDGMSSKYDAEPDLSTLR